MRITKIEGTAKELAEFYGSFPIKTATEEKSRRRKILIKFFLNNEILAMEINIKKLDALIAKGNELKKLLKETPEIITYLRLLNEFDGEKITMPKVDDVLLRAGEAAEILGVNKSTMPQPP